MGIEVQNRIHQLKKENIPIEAIVGTNLSKLPGLSKQQISLLGILDKGMAEEHVLGEPFYAGGSFDTDKERLEAWEYAHRTGLINGIGSFTNDDLFMAETHVLIDNQTGITYLFDLPSREYLEN